MERHAFAPEMISLVKRNSCGKARTRTQPRAFVRTHMQPYASVRNHTHPHAPACGHTAPTCTRLKPHCTHMHPRAPTLDAWPVRCDLQALEITMRCSALAVCHVCVVCHVCALCAMYVPCTMYVPYTRRDLQALEIARACRDMLGGNGIQVEYRPWLG